MAEGGASVPGRGVRNRSPDRRGGGRGSEGHTDGIIQFTGSVTQHRCPGDSCHHLPIYFLTPSLSKHFLAGDGPGNVPGEGDTGVMKSLPLPSRGSQSGTETEALPQEVQEETPGAGGGSAELPQGQVGRAWALGWAPESGP